MSLSVSSQFSLPKSVAELPSINEGLPLLSNILEVNPMRNCIKENFNSGPIKFQFNVPSNERAKLDESYFRIRMGIYASYKDDAGNWQWRAPTKSFPSYISGKSSDANGAPSRSVVADNDNFGGTGGDGFVNLYRTAQLNLPIMGDDVSFSENPASALFQSINFKIGGQIVSEVNNYQPQIDTAVRRLTESYVQQQCTKWRDLFGTTLRERIDMVSSNARPKNYSIGANGGNIGLSKLNKFEQSEGNFGLQGQINISESASIQFPSTCPYNANQIEVLWRPRSLGAFNTGHFLPVGNYEIELNTYTDYAYNCIESIRNIPSGKMLSAGTANPTEANQYKVEILDFRFFVPTCASEQYYSDLDFYLSLTEYQMQVRPIDVGGSNILNLVVPWSTQTLCSMMQTNTVGKQSVVPINKFLNIRTDNGQINSNVRPNVSIDQNSNNLQSIQFNYGKIYPKVLYTTVLSSYGSHNYPIGYSSMPEQFLIQRYEDTFSNSLSNFEVGQMEPFASADKAITSFTPKTTYGRADDADAIVNPDAYPVSYVAPNLGFNTCDFLSRGLITCVSVAKDSAQKNTDLVVTFQYNNSKATFDHNNNEGLDARGNPQLLVMSIYKKTAHVVMQQGAVISVESILG